MDYKSAKLEIYKLKGDIKYTKIREINDYFYAGIVQLNYDQMCASCRSFEDDTGLITFYNLDTLDYMQLSRTFLSLHGVLC